MKRFEDAVVWRRARLLVRGIYGAFKETRDYGFKDQIQRAAVSVMNNTAEGFERKGDRELLRYFSIALGSLGEVRSMLYTAEDLHYLSHEVADNFRNDCWVLRGLILRFMEYLRGQGVSSDIRTNVGPSDA